MRRRRGGFNSATTAAVLVSVQTFLDLGARAERHRISLVAYKKLLRGFERMHVSGELSGITDESLLGRHLFGLQAELSETDAQAPLIAPRIAAAIERRPVSVVGQATDVSPRQSGNLEPLVREAGPAYSGRCERVLMSGEEGRDAWQDYHQRQEFEHDLINRKTMWWLTAQAPLFAAGAEGLPRSAVLVSRGEL